VRVVQVNWSDTLGGAARTAYRLHAELRRSGTDSVLLVQRRDSGDESVVLIQSSLGRLVAHSARTLDRWTLVPFPRRKGLFTSAFAPDGIRGSLHRLVPDVVHFHWVGFGFPSLRTIAGVSVPSVWTLHDSWAFTGGCHLPGECERFTARCGRCPLLASHVGWDPSRWVWHRKRAAISGSAPAYVAPSQWLASQAAKSSLLGRQPVRVIPNAVDTEVFRPLGQHTAREVLGIPGDRKVVLFSAVGGDRDPNKGFSLLLEAIASLPIGLRSVLELVVVGASAVSAEPSAGVRIRCLGAMRDDVAMTIAYGCADVVAVPSRSENCPNVVLEALACGVPVVGFKVGGMPELVKDGVTGRLAEPFDTRDLATAIEWALKSSDAKWVSDNARRAAVELFGIQLQSTRYRRLYEELCAANESDHRE